MSERPGRQGGAGLGVAGFGGAVKHAGFVVLRGLSSLLRDRQQANCVLVLQYMVPLGGCVHATPLFEALAQEFPSLPVVVATHGVGLEVLRHNPHVKLLLATPDARRDFRTAGRALRDGLGQRGLTPAWVLTDLSNPRSRISLLNTVYLRRRLAGFGLAAGLQDVALERDRGRSLIANNLRLVEAVGGLAAHPGEPRVYTSPAAADEARRLLAEVNPAGQAVAVFATQASGGQPSEWHPERMQGLAAKLVAGGILPVFVGTEEQSAAIHGLRVGSGGQTASLAGRTSIPVLAALLALADLCVSIDTGTMHVARSSGVPMVVLAPTYQDAVEWLPLGVEHIRVLRGEGTTPVAASYRLDEIQVEEATAAVEDLLARFVPDAGARERRLAAIVSGVDHMRGV